MASVVQLAAALWVGAHWEMRASHLEQRGICSIHLGCRLGGLQAWVHVWMELPHAAVVRLAELCCIESCAIQLQDV